MGWVSVLKLPQLRKILGIPPHVIPVAYLCLGYPVEFPSQPLLQTMGWRDRLPVSGLLHHPFTCLLCPDCAVFVPFPVRFRGRTVRPDGSVSCSRASFSTPSASAVESAIA